jgi:hypothetical protein
MVEPETDRQIIPLHEQLRESQLWDDIKRAAKKNPALQLALDRVKLLYYLSNPIRK